MKLRKVALKGKELFEDRLVFAAEPGKGVRKLFVARKAKSVLRYSTVLICNDESSLPKVPLTKRHRHITGVALVTWIKKYNQNIDESEYLNKWAVVEDFAVISPAVVFLPPDSETGYNWPLDLTRGEDSAVRFFAKEKHALKYAARPKVDGLESLFDFMDE